MTQALPEVLVASMRAGTPLGRLGTVGDVAAVTPVLAKRLGVVHHGQAISPNGGLLIS